MLFEVKKKTKGKDLYTKCSDMILEHTEDSKLRDKLFEYLNLLLEIGNFYPNMWKAILNQLNEYANNDLERQYILVQESLLHGWRKIVDVKSYGNRNFDNTEGVKVPKRWCDMGDFEKEEDLSDKKY